jgi:hypothetical protein
MSPLILKRDPVGQNQEDYSVLENGVIVGRIFLLNAVGPQGRPWMWASGHNGSGPFIIVFWVGNRADA